MTSRTSGLRAALLAGALLAAGCSSVQLTDAGHEEDGGRVIDDSGQDAATMGEDSGPIPELDAAIPMDATGCMTGMFETSTFGDACFGD